MRNNLQIKYNLYHNTIIQYKLKTSNDTTHVYEHIKTNKLMLKESDHARTMATVVHTWKVWVPQHLVAKATDLEVGTHYFSICCPYLEKDYTLLSYGQQPKACKLLWSITYENKTVYNPVHSPLCLVSVYNCSRSCFLI